MENEIDNLYFDENNGEFPENAGLAEVEQLQDHHSEVPPDFHYTPVKIPHKIDWFVVILSLMIIGVLCYVLFATSGIFE